MSLTKRDYRIDGIKFLLICLVIIGHYIEPSRYKSDVSGTLYSLIYMLHMPLFVMISGYFCGEQSLKKLNKFTMRMFEVIAIVIGVSYFFINSNIESVFIFTTPLWFILSLVYWKWYSYLLDISGVSRGFQVVISYVIAISGFIFLNDNQEFLSASRAFQFLPYFSIGRWISNKSFSFNKSAAWTLIIILSLAAIFLSSRTLHLFEFQREGLFILATKVKMPIYICFTLKMSLWALTAFVSIMLINIVRMPRIFEKYGKYTLSIFCFHCYSYPLVIRYFHTLHYELLLSMISIVLFVIIARKEIISKFITNPVSLLINVSKNYSRS